MSIVGYVAGERIWIGDFIKIGDDGKLYRANAAGYDLVACQNVERGGVVKQPDHWPHADIEPRYLKTARKYGFVVGQSDLLNTPPIDK